MRRTSFVISGAILGAAMLGGFQQQPRAAQKSSPKAEPKSPPKLILLNPPGKTLGKPGTCNPCDQGCPPVPGQSCPGTAGGIVISDGSVTISGDFTNANGSDFTPKASHVNYVNVQAQTPFECTKNHYVTTCNVECPPCKMDITLSDGDVIQVRVDNDNNNLQVKVNGPHKFTPKNGTWSHPNTDVHVTDTSFLGRFHWEYLDHPKIYFQ